jgi:hypothetical protein
MVDEGVRDAGGDYGACFDADGCYHYSCDDMLSLGERWMGTRRKEVPKRTECMVSSSVMQCQVLNIAIMAVMTIPEVMVVVRDLSKVKTRWRTVAVAMSMERSSTLILSVSLKRK